MKAITISQPFASMIASGEKWIENRTWKTSYRGPLAIHAGKGSQYLNRKQLAKYPTGGVIAVARLTASVALTDLFTLPATGDTGILICPGCTKTLMDIHTHEYTEGPYCWVLEDVREVPFSPCRGSLGLWDWEGHR